MELITIILSTIAAVASVAGVVISRRNSKAGIYRRIERNERKIMKIEQIEVYRVNRMHHQYHPDKRLQAQKNKLISEINYLKKLL